MVVFVVRIATRELDVVVDAAHVRGGVANHATGHHGPAGQAGEARTCERRLVRGGLTVVDVLLAPQHACVGGEDVGDDEEKAQRSGTRDERGPPPIASLQAEIPFLRLMHGGRGGVRAGHPRITTGGAGATRVGVQVTRQRDE